MLNRLRKMLAPSPAENTKTGPDPLAVATCALLLEVAEADDEFSDTERDHIVIILRSRFELSHSDAHALIDISHQAREASSDLWHFTRRINEECSVIEKIRIVEEIWRVVFADGTLDGHEDYLVHKLAQLLNLNHPQLIDAKLRARGKA